MPRGVQFESAVAAASRLTKKQVTLRSRCLNTMLKLDGRPWYLAYYGVGWVIRPRALEIPTAEKIGDLLFCKSVMTDPLRMRFVLDEARRKVLLYQSEAKDTVTKHMVLYFELAYVTDVGGSSRIDGTLEQILDKYRGEKDPRQRGNRRR